MKKVIFSLLFFLCGMSVVWAQKNVDEKITELTKEAFTKKVWNYEKDKSYLRISKLPVILDFHASWCRPCHMLAPHLEAVQDKYKGKLIVYKIDVDKEPELAELFKIQAMPTIIFMGSKTKYTRELGYRGYEELEQLVQKNLFPETK